MISDSRPREKFLPNNPIDQKHIIIKAFSVAKVKNGYKYSSKRVQKLIKSFLDY